MRTKEGVFFLFLFVCLYFLLASFFQRIQRIFLFKRHLEGSSAVFLHVGGNALLLPCSDVSPDPPIFSVSPTVAVQYAVKTVTK